MDQIEIDAPKGTTTRLACTQCGRETKHHVHARVKTWAENDRYAIHERFQIVQCCGCDDFSFCRDTECDADMILDDEGDYVPRTRRTVFPPRLVGRRLMEHTHLLPEKVRRIYVETQQAMVNDMPIAAGFGMRAIVEAVCIDRTVKQGTLEKRIDAMQSKGLVTSDGASILHCLRFMGNKAAHEITPHTAPELAAAMDVVEHLLQTVYIIPETAKALRTPPARGAGRASKRAPRKA